MSSGYWQTKRQTEQFASGGTITQKIKAYTLIWESRCYSDGIPDEVPAKLASVNRAPSWKAIAMAILKNDHNLRSLGFGVAESELVLQLVRERKEKESRQIRIVF